jgi:hypothetical protein
MYLSSGDPYELMTIAGLDVKDIIAAHKDVLGRRPGG